MRCWVSLRTRFSCARFLHNVKVRTAISGIRVGRINHSAIMPLSPPIWQSIVLTVENFNASNLGHAKSKISSVYKKITEKVKRKNVVEQMLCGVPPSVNILLSKRVVAWFCSALLSGGLYSALCC